VTSGGRLFARSRDDIAEDTVPVSTPPAFRASGAVTRLAGGLHQSDGVVTRSEREEAQCKVT
jgi:hypothetical protein